MVRLNPPPLTFDRFRVNTTWLIKLRWVAVAGQILTVAGASFAFNVRLQLIPLTLVILLTALSNIMLMLWFNRQASRSATEVPIWNLVLGLVMTMDLLSLTALLYVSGGPTNPFWLFYFVNLSLCAVVLDRRWAWGLTLLSVLCFTWLLYDHYPLMLLDFGSALDAIRLRGRVSVSQAGLLVAFAACASVVVYFMTRLTGELRQQEWDLRHAQHLQARSEKWEALGTLAAGAAHELATPLSTIAIVARDVEQAIEQGQNSVSSTGQRSASATPEGVTVAAQSAHRAEILDDIRLIRGQLDRCRRILNRMAGHAGQTVGETLRPVTLERLVKEVVDGFPLDRLRVQVPAEAESLTCSLPLDAVSQSLRGLVQNALDVQPPNVPVTVDILAKPQEWDWWIEDRGPGMDTSVMRRLSEPFFTTKPPGKNMGLGVFLARSVIERIGGTLQYHSTPGKGTKVNVVLPTGAATNGYAISSSS